MPDWWYKREAVVDVINISQEVTVFGKVVRSSFLFKMSSRGLFEVKKSIVLTKRHSTIYWLWKWYGNPAKTVSPYNNLKQREHIRELLIFSGLHIPLAFQSVWSPSVIPPTRHMVVMPRWCRLSDTVHGISVYFVQKLSLYLPAENACSAGLLAHTVARHWDLGGGTLERTQPRGTETAWSVVHDATLDTWYSLLDTRCWVQRFQHGSRWGQVGPRSTDWDPLSPCVTANCDSSFTGGLMMDSVFLVGCPGEEYAVVPFLTGALLTWQLGAISGVNSQCRLWTPDQPYLLQQPANWEDSLCTKNTGLAQSI